MTPGFYSLDIYRGDTYQWRFQLWQDEARTDPLDLTDAQVASEIRDKSGGALIIALDCTITPPNIIDATLPASSSAQCPPRGVWDLQLTFPGADVMTVVGGLVNVTGDVTGSSS